jgi:membrane-bound lytic murein transglycosylase A
MVYRWWWWCVWTSLVLGLMALSQCSRERRPVEPGAQQLLSFVPQPLSDDLDRSSLQEALQRSLDYVRRLPADRLLPLAGRQIPVGILRDTLETFQHTLTQAPTTTALYDRLRTQFEFIPATGQPGHDDVLFTGYYEAVLPGSRVPTAEFTYPLYTTPTDLLQVDLGAFRPDWAGERLVARYDHGRMLPYFTRHDIDVEGKLRGRHLELVWLRDAVDGFFLHVQGSGQIHLLDGTVMRVNYAASNGHPYRSIGRLLLDEKHLQPAAMSLQSVQRYLRTHPTERSRIFSHNPRYVFFRQVDTSPTGSLGFPLVPGRSIATDPRLFPPAALAFIQTHKPVLNAANEVIAWQPFSRFVFNHDTGSAITGPGRVDLFWGSGPAAEAAAGRLQHPGNLFFLLKRSPTQVSP